jgi:hypothetical protein
VRTQIWASGGGVQSAAIAALIVQGKLHPDLAVIVDTEREQSTTWDYMDAVISPALESVGVVLHRVKKSDFATVDLYGGEEEDSLLIPAFTTQGDGVGKLPTFCSNEWKRRVVQRWATAQGVKLATMWLGISTDERQRLSFVAGKWENSYPLVDAMMNRGDCMALVAKMGWPTPPRSSCWMCPNHTTHEWRDIKDNKPKDWQQAIRFDREIRKRDPNAFLHQGAIPLEEADFTERNGDLFDKGCASGYCFT